MPGITESDVVAFFHHSRAEAKRNRRLSSHEERFTARIEEIVEQRYLAWRDGVIANAKAARDTYERAIER